VRAASAYAGIEWQQKTIEAAAGFNQQDVKAGFVFRNTGDRPVTITSVNSNCDCTTAELEKKTYAPGESGRINVMFEIGDYTGQHDAHILVTTDTPSVPPTDLVLRVGIPEYLRLEPRITQWRVGGDAAAKTIVCTALEKQSIDVTEVQSTDPSMITHIEALERGRKYAIHLQPTSTANYVVATIQLRVAIAGVGTRIVQAYAYVKGP
jgi:hypothetical protein